MQAMVIVTSGTNCDLELAQAFEDAGPLAKRCNCTAFWMRQKHLMARNSSAFPAASRMATRLRPAESKPR